MRIPGIVESSPPSLDGGLFDITAMARTTLAMNLTNARATFGLNCKATPTSSNVSGTVQIGASNSSLSFPDADVAYSIRGIFAGSGDSMVLDLTTGSTSGSTAFVAGVAQVATATAAGTVSAGGNASVTVTSAGMTGSPKAISVAVATDDTPTLWAAKVRAALNADADFSALYTASGSTTAIVATRNPTTFTVPGGTLNLYAENDATLNIALATGTATGITTASTSTATTAGVNSDGVKIYDNATDFEGVAIPTISQINGILLKSNLGDFDVTGDSTNSYPASLGTTLLIANSDLISCDSIITCVPNGIADIAITVIGQTS